MARRTFDEVEPYPVWLGFVIVLAAIGSELYGPESPVERVLVLVGILYYLALVYRFHLVLRLVSNGEYIITPIAAVAGHALWPIWVFVWTSQFAAFAKRYESINPVSVAVAGIGLLGAVVIAIFVDGAASLVLLILVMAYLQTYLRVMLLRRGANDG